MDMSQNERFCLCLKKYEDNMKTYWQEFQNEEDFFDVTISCEDKHIKVHRTILSLCSPILKSILKSKENSNPLIYLPGVNFKELENLIKFMYQGEISIAEIDIQGFIKLAEDLQINGLCNGTQDHAISDQRNAWQQKQKQKLRRTTGNVNIETNIGEIDSISTSYKGSIINQSININGAIDNITETLEAYEVSINEDSNSEEFTAQYRHQNNVSSRKKDKTNTQHFKKSMHTRKEFPCNKCNYIAKLRHHLIKHVESIHEGIRYPCSQCNYQAKEQGSLKKHIESVHEKIRYPCERCNHQASGKYGLKKHIEGVHEGLRYKCLQCGYKASDKFILRDHIVDNHNIDDE